MIKFSKKPADPVAPATPAVQTDANRVEVVRKAAADRQKKSDTDGSRRRDRQTAENNRLI